LPVVAGALACIGSWAWARLRLGKMERALEPETTGVLAE